MYKNVASQKVAILAWDGSAGNAKTGDAANITAEISLDGGVSAATNDLNPTELDATDHPGIYIFDLTQAETNADLVIITPVSSTDNIVIRPIIATPTLLTVTEAGYLDASISTVDTVVDGIKAVTDNLPNSGALTTLITHLTDIKGAGWVDENLTTIDTIIDAIKVVTDNLPNSGSLNDLATILTDTNELQTDWTNGGRLDLLVDAIKAKTDNLPTDPADQSQVEAAISTAESNIRGIDSDDLKNISDEIAALNNITVADVLAGVIEGAYTLQQSLRVVLALVSKGTITDLGGGSYSVKYRDTADSKNRADLTVDEDGNRTASTLDLT